MLVEELSQAGLAEGGDVVSLAAHGLARVHQPAFGAGQRLHAGAAAVALAGVQLGVSCSVTGRDQGGIRVPSTRTTRPPIASDGSGTSQSSTAAIGSSRSLTMREMAG